MRIKEAHSFKLLVEGNDDQHVIWSLCQHHDIAENFDVIDCESIENVIKQAEIRITTEASRNLRVGIIIDADVDHTYLAWQEDPGTPMGLAITKKYLKPDSPNCLPFVNWLKELFK